MIPKLCPGGRARSLGGVHGDGRHTLDQHREHGADPLELDLRQVVQDLEDLWWKKEGTIEL